MLFRKRKNLEIPKFCNLILDLRNQKPNCPDTQTVRATRGTVYNTTLNLKILEKFLILFYKLCVSTPTTVYLDPATLHKNS